MDSENLEAQLTSNPPAYFMAQLMEFGVLAWRTPSEAVLLVCVEVLHARPRAGEPAPPTIDFWKLVGRQLTTR
jgi:hypothetical protein